MRIRENFMVNIFRKFMFFIFDLMVYKLDFLKVLREYMTIKSNIHQDVSINLKIQKFRLFKLLNYSIKYVPFYKKIAKKENFNLSLDTIFEDIKQFPIINKSTIRNYHEKLCSNHNNKIYRINTSGGTTGEPVRIPQGKNYFFKGHAATLAFNEIGNCYPGTKTIKLWGDERDILNDSKGILSLFLKIFKNLSFQNSFMMSEKTLLKYINEINEEKPRCIIAYVQSIYELAKFIEYHDIDIHSPNSIITSSGVLTPRVKGFIENTFKTRVYNRYGSRELGLIGMSCEKSSKLHINMYQQYVEITNDRGERIPSNQKGNIIITNLNNYIMPLIRYKIGDVGSLNKKDCKCGRGLIRLNKIYGRVVDIFKNSSGDIIDGEYFTHLFYFVKNLKKFQVIQEKKDLIKIFLVTIDGTKLENNVESAIINKIKIVMGENCRVIIDYVNSIHPSKSGKHRYTISNI
jgi:phenylacetate-CoA ligase